MQKISGQNSKFYIRNIILINFSWKEKCKTHTTITQRGYRLIINTEFIEGKIEGKSESQNIHLDN